MNQEPASTKEETAKLQRLIIARNDLAESRRYINACLDFTDTPAYSEAYGALGMEMAECMTNALLSYGLICYARPFTQSRGSAWKKVPGRFTSAFTKEERQIHNYVLEARRKLIAHSDVEGVYTNSVETDRGGKIILASPVPIVMIPDEEDSLNIDLAAKRSIAFAKNTLNDFSEIVKDVDAEGSEASRVFLHQDRVFDIATNYCISLVEMTEKVDEAISRELKFS